MNLKEGKIKLGAKAFVVYEKRVLLILRDDNPSISYPDTWNLPGGGVEKGENFEEALRRELHEELNLELKSFLCMGMESFPEDNKVVVRYLIRLEKKDVDGLKLGEGKEMNFFSFGEIFDLTFSPYLGNFILRNKEYLQRIIEENEKIVPEKLGLTPPIV